METHVAACCPERREQEPHVRCRHAAQRTLSVRARVRLEQLDEQGRPLAQIGVSSAMSQRAFVCRRQDLLSVAEHTMAAHRVRRLPVVDDEGVLVGMLSLNDIVLARTRSPLRSAAERLLGDVVQTLAAISQHRGASQSMSAAPKRAAEASFHSTTGGSP